jgi:hypothetical protein
MTDKSINEKNEGQPVERWSKPNIYSPTAGAKIFPGFQVQCGTGYNGSEWSAEIYTGPHKLATLKGGYNGKEWFDFWVPQDLIAPGTPFYFKVDYYLFPAWSAWAWSADFTMGLPKPIIRPPSPVNGEHNKAYGRGYPNATVRLYEAGYGGVVHGTAVVDSDGNWEANINPPLSGEQFPMTANQVINNTTSDWADTVEFPVLRKFIYTDPTDNTIINRKPTIRGVGHPGASVVLTEKNHDGVIYGTATVTENGTWESKITTALPVKNNFYLAGQQRLDETHSSWVDLRLHVLPLTGELDEDLDRP